MPSFKNVCFLLASFTAILTERARCSSVKSYIFWLKKGVYPLITYPPPTTPFFLLPPPLLRSPDPAKKLTRQIGAAKIAQIGVAKGSKEGQFIRSLAKWLVANPAVEGLAYPVLVGGSSRDDVSYSGRSDDVIAGGSNDIIPGGLTISLRKIG